LSAFTPANVSTRTPGISPKLMVKYETYKAVSHYDLRLETVWE
jgi:hypothetical protein